MKGGAVLFALALVATLALAGLCLDEAGSPADGCCGAVPCAALLGLSLFIAAVAGAALRPTAVPASRSLTGAPLAPPPEIFALSV